MSLHFVKRGILLRYRTVCILRSFLRGISDSAPKLHIASKAEG